MDRRKFEWEECDFNFTSIGIFYIKAIFGVFFFKQKYIHQLDITV